MAGSPDITKLKKQSDMDKAAHANADLTASGSTSGWSQTVTAIQDGVSAVYTGAQAIAETVAESAIYALEIVEQASEAGQDFYQTLVDAVTDPVAANSDYDATLSRTPENKDDPNKECGTISLIGSAANVIKQTVVGLRDTVSHFGPASFDMTAKHCLTLGVQTLLTIGTDQKLLIDTILADCDSVYDLVAKTTRPINVGSTSTIVTELLGLVNAVQGNVSTVYSDYLNHTLFNQDAWTDAYQGLDDAATFIIDNLSTSTDTSSLPILVSGSSFIKIKAYVTRINANTCLLSTGVSRMQDISGNLDTTSNADFVTPFEANMLACIDRTNCHLDYMVKITNKLLTKGILEANAVTLDLYGHFKEISVVMENLTTFLDKMATNSQKNMTYTEDNAAVEEATINTMGFKETIDAFSNEALSILYDARSTKRLGLLRDKLYVLGANIQTSLEDINGGFLDPDNEYQNTVNEALSVANVAYEYGLANYDTWLGYLKTGSFSDAFNLFVNDFMINQLENLLTAENLSTDTRAYIRSIIDRRKKENRMLGVAQLYQDRAKQATKENLSQQKRNYIEDLKLYKAVAGFVATFKEVSQNVAKVQSDIGDGFRTVFTTLDAADKKLFDVNCGRIMR